MNKKLATALCLMSMVAVPLWADNTITLTVDGKTVEKNPVQITFDGDNATLVFDNQETTDDHGMVIVGSAVDQKGNKYYKVKNSWDTNQVYGGYFYVSVPYFLAKTIGVYVHRDAVPSAILAKLK